MAKPKKDEASEALAAMGRLRTTFHQGNNRYGTYGQNVREAFDRWALRYSEITGNRAPNIYD